MKKLFEKKNKDSFVSESLEQVFLWLLRDSELLQLLEVTDDQS